MKEGFMDWMGQASRHVAHFIEGLDMRERWAFILKGAVVGVALFFCISRPPAVAQMRQTPIDLAPETQAVQNALVNNDVANLRMDLTNQRLELDKLKEVQNLQGNSITALDTSWKAAMGFIAFLQAGGMVLSYRRKTV